MRELLFTVTKDDFDETHIRGTGPGGQKKNKTHSGVRLVHRASGATGESTASRSQQDNRVRAFQAVRETPEWKAWYRTQVAVAMGRPTLEQRVEEWTQDKYVRTQVHDDRGRWVDVQGDSLAVSG